MPEFSPQRVTTAARMLRSRVAAAAFRRVMARQLARAASTVTKRVDSIVSRGPDRRAGAWTTTDPTVWRAATPTRGDGPLDGARFVVKDSFDVAGTSGSSGAFIQRPLAQADATLVQRARRGGGLLVGKVQMCEQGVGGLGIQTHFGTLDNPAAPGYVPGGSSCGTAVAIASGLVDVGIGTDAMGSVRIPSAFCGLVGLKPTQGALPLLGYHCVAPSLDCPGPMARTAEECAALWRVISDSTREPWGVTARAPVKIGVIRQLSGVPVWTPIVRAQERALSRLGSELVEVSVELALVAITLGTICGSRELADAMAVRGGAGRQAAPIVQLTVAMGAAIGGRLYKSALDVRQRLRQQMLTALDGVDVLAMPTTSVPAPALTPNLAKGGVDTDVLLAVGAFTPLASVTGLPAISVPVGHGPKGRPLAMMLVARPGGEERLLSAAAAVELVR